MTPYLAFFLFISGSSVATYLAPVHPILIVNEELPNGCPKAMAPPFGFTLVGSIPIFSTQ